MNYDASFLGTGWNFPPTFTQGGADVVMVSGYDDIQQSLQILLSTSLGERVMQESFGADLNSLVFEEIDQTLLNTLRHIVSDAILYHEPRIVLDGLDVTESPDESGLLLITIRYTVPSTNSRFNQVYPFYINESNLL
jgi:uncharacterized protein